MCQIVLQVLGLLKKHRVSFASFMDALFWGDEDCWLHPVIYNTRARFLQSEKFSELLWRWYSPPRSKRSKKSRSLGARNALEAFASKYMSQTLEKELRAIDPLVRAAPGTFWRREELTGLSIPGLREKFKERAPRTWNLLISLATTPGQRARNTHKSCDNVLLLVIAVLLYSRSHHCNLVQRILALYFKYKGLTAKGCDTLHSLGVTMSSKWTTNAIDRLSTEEKAELQHLFDCFASVLTWDNVNIQFHVFAQRLDKKTHLGSGTAAMVFVKRSAPRQPLRLVRELQAQRAWGMAHPLQLPDILAIHESTAGAILRWMAHHVLETLLNAPEFDLKSYHGAKAAALKSPSPVHEIPCGPEHVTEEYMLGTMAQPEQSFEDNNRVLTAILRQLGIKSREQAYRFGESRLLFTVGDQLTIDRVRGLQQFRCQDCNPSDRLDYVVPVWGWLHFQMAVARSLHKQYLGTTSGLGWKHAFALLERKGLDSPATQGPFHDNFERAMYDIMEARIRGCWLQVGRVASLDKLRECSPEELARMAVEIVERFASTAALNREMSRQERERDRVFEHTIMFNRDVLHYIVLDQAIKRGDTGLMEAMLPVMLLRFVGGRSSNYTGETLEMLQSLHREWPPAVSNFVREHCWLINRTGKRHAHTPVDRGMEAGVKKIKVAHRPQGPYVDWEYMYTFHWVIPVIDALAAHVEEEFAVLSRGKRHTSPRDDWGISLLQDAYTANKIYEYNRARPLKLGKDDTARNFIDEGLKKLPVVLERWISGRTYTRSKASEYPSQEELSDLEY
ncbi:hypothetical protein FKP32DRAFT_1564214 [Trametes sanguinea]|nr:hypothetical protein FKP32DRAFT_1564214 [Trametes sanguinea]